MWRSRKVLSQRYAHIIKHPRQGIERLTAGFVVNRGGKRGCWEIIMQHRIKPLSFYGE